MTLFLLKLIGISMTTMGLGILMNRKRYAGMVEAFEKNVLMTYFIGLSLTILGSAYVLSHNVWGTMEQNFVSAIGWITLVKGLMYFLFPGMAGSLVKSLKPIAKNYLLFGGVVSLAAGIWALSMAGMI